MKRKFPPLLLIPAILILGTTVLIPVVYTFLFSLQKYKLTEPNDIHYVGFSNYAQALASESFQTATVNTTYVLVLTLILGLLLSLGTALLLAKKTKLSPVLLGISMLPWAMPPIVNGVLWKFLFFPGAGFVNTLLMKVGLIDAPILWTTNRFLFLTILSVVVVWRVVPFASLVLMANMERIPKSLYDAFSLDGGSKRQAFFRITLPLLLPSLGITLMQFTTSAMHVFDEVVAMSGYQMSTQTLMIHTYVQSFQFLDFGMGSAVSYLLMLLSGIVGIFYVHRMTAKPQSRYEKQDKGLGKRKETL